MILPSDRIMTPQAKRFDSRRESQKSQESISRSRYKVTSAFDPICDAIRKDQSGHDVSRPPSSKDEIDLPAAILLGSRLGVGTGELGAGPDRCS
jgi:hypothetical protein